MDGTTQTLVNDLWAVYTHRLRGGDADPFRELGIKYDIENGWFFRNGYATEGWHAISFVLGIDSVVVLQWIDAVSHAKYGRKDV